MAHLAPSVLLLVAFCSTGSTAQTITGFCSKTDTALQCMRKVFAFKKTDLLAKLGSPDFSFGNRPTLPSGATLRYEIEAKVANGTNINLEDLEIKKAQSGNGFELTLVTRWRPVITTFSEFNLCFPSSVSVPGGNCLYTTSIPTISVNDEFRKISQWAVSTGQPPLRLLSSRKGTFRVGHTLTGFPSIRSPFSGTFESIIRNIILGRNVVEGVRDSLTRALDQWIDEDALPTFAREIVNRDEFA